MNSGESKLSGIKQFLLLALAGVLAIYIADRFIGLGVDEQEFVLLKARMKIVEDRIRVIPRSAGHGRFNIRDAERLVESINKTNRANGLTEEVPAPTHQPLLSGEWDLPGVPQ